MRTRDTVSAGLLILTLATSILLVGGAMRWAQAIVMVVVAAALVPSLWSKRHATTLSPLVALIGLAAAFTALQLLPLPEVIAGFFDPAGNALRTDGAVLAGTTPATTLSRDPPATLRALGVLVALLGVAIVALRMSTRERGRYYVVASIAIVIGVAAFITIAHEIVGTTSLYGIYTPRATPSVLGPLLNENHLGGLMAVGAVSAIGLLFYERQATWVRGMWLLLIIACSATTVLTRSRGASVALAAGVIVAMGVIAARRFGSKSALHGRRRFLTGILPIGVVATSTIVIAIYASGGGLQRELERTSLHEIDSPRSKFEAWRSAVSLIKESPWVGVGRGAMESSFTRVHPPSGQVTFSYVENEYIQTVVDYGIPVALALAGIAVWLAIVAVRRWRTDALAAAALGGMACIAVQSNVDFGTELLGVAVPVVALAATLTYTHLRVSSPGSLRVHRALSVGLMGLLLAGAGMMLVDSTRSIDEDRERIEDTKGKVTLGEIAEIIERHPSSYYPFAVAAQHFARLEDPKAIRFLNHAMLLHPTHPGLHHMAARLLRRGGYDDQAIIEYAATLRATPQKQRVLAEILATFPDEKAALVLDDVPVEIDAMVKMLVDLKRPHVATLWLTRQLKTRSNPRACEVLFEISLQGNDLAAAEAAGRHCLGMMPDRHTRHALARLLYANKHYAEILPLLADVDEWRGRIDDAVTAWLLLCDARIGLGNLDEAKHCLRRLEASGDVRGERQPEVKNRFEQIEALRRESPAKL